MSRLLLLACLVGCQEYTIEKYVDPVGEDLDTDIALGLDPVGDTDAGPTDPTNQEQTPEVDPGEVFDQWVVPENPEVDILFALDKSCSMTSEVFALGNAFSNFIQQLNDVTSGWHVGVVTADTGCFNEGWMDVNTPNYISRFRRATSGFQLFNTDLEEALLQLADVALGKAVPGRCNDGFIRPGAALHLIAVSDEPEQSGTNWDVWLDSYRDHYDLVVVSAVADINGSCGDAPLGYQEAVTATGGLMLDVCNSRWASFAAELGQVSAEAARSYVLSEVPIVDSIVVRVNGALATGWQWDAARNAIVLSRPPPAGTRIDVVYTPA